MATGLHGAFNRLTAPSSSSKRTSGIWLCAQGLFGLGLGDAPTAQEAVAAAYMDAFNKLTAVPLYRSHTTYNHIEHQYNSLKVRGACTAASGREKGGGGRMPKGNQGPSLPPAHSSMFGRASTISCEKREI